jgi:iron(III) transport system ATP-binding protein
MSSSTDDLVLSCRGLRKSFGPRVVLDDLDLDVVPRGVTSILGPSGGGKTTLLRMIAGFEPIDAGTIVVHGRVVAGHGRPVPPERRRIGIVPQEGALFPHLSVGANVGFGLPRGPVRRARVAECLELVDLRGLERARPHELSGGQQQRVALARALAPRPELVLLDEPFSSLDTGLRAQVRADVCDALARAGATAILVTHDQEEALSVARAVGVLLDGRLAQVADPITLYQSPVSRAVAEFVGDAVVLRGTVEDGWVQCPLGRLPCVPGTMAAGAVDVVTRPEQIVLCPHSGPDRGSDSITATVTGRSFFGADATVELQLHGADVVVRARVPAHDLPATPTVGVSVVGTVSVFPATP